MRRWAIFVVLPAGFLAVAGAVVPWTISSDVARSAISSRLMNLYGLELAVAGRSSLALLPVPRVTFDNITLSSSNAGPVVRGGSLRGVLRLSSLFAARLDLAELSLTGALIDVEVGDGGHTPWRGPLATVRERFETRDAGNHVRRIVLKDTDLRVHDRRGRFETVLRGIDLTANWPAPGAVLDVTGSMKWRGEPIDITAAGIRPATLLGGRQTKISVQMMAPLARLTLSGDMSWADAPRLVGRATFDSPSLRDFSRWSGIALPLAYLAQPFSLEGDMTVDGSDVSWPTARLSLGGDRLVGALASRLEGERRAITGTLAAERLDLTGFLMPLARARSSGGEWSSEGIDLQGQSGPDLDLRLSASALRIGAVRMEELAANVTVKPGRFEVAVGRIMVNKGVVKGRATLASAADGVEVKGQGSFERIDLASFLGDIGLSRWIGGLAQGQFAVEGAGDNAAEIIRRLHGRANVTVRQGELAGFGLQDSLRRVEGKSSPILLGRSGRTIFDHAHLTAVVSEGTAEISESVLNAAGFRATLQGRAILSDGNVAAKAQVENTASAVTVVYDIKGPWDDVAVTSETMRSDRSGPSASPAASIH